MSTSLGHEGRYEVEVTYDARVPTVDPEVTLSADVYRPVGADPVPALVMVMPYRKDLDSGARLASSFRWCAERGYACVLADLRGTGASDGALRPMHDPGEGDDVVAVIEWAAAQPWCTGDVGMWGMSYAGYTTMRAASRRPPQLKAIIPIMCELDPERSIIHPAGARGDLIPMAYWGGHMLLQQLLPPLLNHTAKAEQRRWRRRLHDTEPHFMDFVRHRVGHPGWRDRVVDPGSITVPALCVGGWRDVYPDLMPHFYERLRGPKKLLMGPWGHTLPHQSALGSIDFLTVALRWWDHWLRGADNGVLDEPPVTIYVQGERPGWRALPSWPAADGGLRLATGATTVLAASAEQTDAPSEVIAEYQPDPTTGALSGLQAIVMGEFGHPQDQHDDDLRAVAATSEPLAHDVVLCGVPEVRVRLRRDEAGESPVLRIVVRLAEVDPLGRSTLLALGVLCPEEDGDDHRLALACVARRVRAGHRLRVVISDSDFPRLRPLVNPQPMRITSIELSAPTLSDEATTASDVPALEQPEAGVGGANWTITRDLIHDGLEVKVGVGTPAAVTIHRHLLETSADIRATVRRDAPAASVVTGTHKARLRTSSGETIAVTAAVRCTQTTLLVRGEVDIDGTTTFSRTWEAPLTDRHEALGPAAGEAR